MKFSTVSIALASLLSLGNTATAATPPGDFRFDMSLNSSAISMGDGLDTLGQSQVGLLLGMTFQSNNGFFGDLGFSKQNVHEVRYNNSIASVDESYSTTVFGFGHRRPIVGSDRYWGLGYQNISFDGGNDSTSVFRTFWEKDNTERYGVIDLAYSRGDNDTMVSVTGKHIWFLNKTTGIGVNWAVGGGGIDNSNIATGMANFGATIMFRPDL